MKKFLYGSIIMALTLAVLLSACGGGGAAIVNISHNNGDSLRPRIAVDSIGTANLVWADLTPGIYTVMYSSGTGNTWSDAKDVSQNAGTYNTFPSMFIDKNDTTYVAWYGQTANGEKIFYSSKTKSGDWSVPLDSSNTTGASENPSIVVDSTGTVHLAWQDKTPGNFSIYYSSMGSDGKWTAPVNISNTTTDALNPSLAVDKNDTLYLAWQDGASNAEDIYYATKPKGGSWSTPVDISNNTGSSLSPAIAVDGNGVPSVVWYDNSIGNWEILYSTLGSNGWTSPLNLSKSSGSSGFPQIAIDNGNTIHVVWHDDTPGKYQIFYIKHPAGGSWSKSTQISDSSANAADPTIAIDKGGTVNIAWSDYSPGNWDIFYTSLK